jgi:hypothetical protein
MLHARGPGHPTDNPHPLIYGIMVCLAALLVVGIYGFSGGAQKYNGLVLVVAILFVIVAVAFPYVLSRILRRRQTDADHSEPFRDWLADEFEIWHGHLKASDAAWNMLLPNIAVSLGMVIFAVELHFAVGGPR